MKQKQEIVKQKQETMVVYIMIEFDTLLTYCATDITDEIRK